MFEVPIILLVFNRPQLTAQLLARIRKIRPNKLFVVADGPREFRPSDLALCREVRELVHAAVDWPCELVKDYSDRNMGSGRRVASGITNAFTLVDEAIILEDDCLPEPEFFRFCEELLFRYRHEPRVGTLGGCPHVEMPGSEASYYFSRYGYSWGWATWKRAWAHFDYHMGGWKQWRDTGGLERMFNQPCVRRYWRNVWNHAVTAPNDIWDYQWVYCYMRAGMLNALPAVPLVENVGFGELATHTNETVVQPKRDRCLSFPLVHPSEIAPNMAAENLASRRYFWREPTIVRALSALRRRWRPL